MTHPAFMQTIVEARLETLHRIAADIRAEKSLENRKPSLAKGIANRVLAIFKTDTPVKDTKIQTGTYLQI